MWCWDCLHTGAGAAAAVVGVCSVCGAALCHEHAQVCPSRDTQPAGSGGTVPTAPAGRRLCCATCRDAGRAGSQYSVGSGTR